MENCQKPDSHKSHEDLVKQNIELMAQLSELQKKLDQANLVTNISQQDNYMGTWEVDLVNDKQVWSENYCKLLGYDRIIKNPTEELFYSHVYSRDVELVKNTMQNCLSTKSPCTLEFRYVSKDGTVKYCKSTANYLFDEHENIIKIIGVFQDITTQKTNEKELTQINEISKKNIAQLKLSLKASNAGTWNWDIESDEVCWDNRMHEIFGLEPGSFDGKYQTWKNIVHPKDRERADEETRKALESGRNYDFQYRLNIKTRSGRFKRVRAMAIVENNHNNEPISMAGFCEDITDSKHFEDSLIKNQFYLSKAQEIGKIGTWELDIVNNRLHWTKENYNVFGVKAGTELTYETFLSTIYVDDVEYVDREWTKAMQGQPYDIEHRILVNEQIKWVREKAEVKFDENGKAISAIGFTQDITDKKKPEIALQKSRERFELAMKASKDGLYDWNLITNEIYYSPGWKNILGYEDHELPNDFSVWEKLTEPEDVKKAWEMQQELIQKKRDRFELEFKMKHKHGHWVEILSRAEAIFNPK